MGIQDDVVKQLLFLVKYPCLVVCISVFFERIDFIGVALCGGGLLYDRTMSMFGKSVCCQCLWGAGLDDMITMVVVQGRMRKYQRSECFTYIILPAYNKYLKNASILIDIPGKRSAKSLTGFSGELGGTEWREEMQESLY